MYGMLCTSVCSVFLFFFLALALRVGVGQVPIIIIYYSRKTSIYRGSGNKRTEQEKHAVLILLFV